MLNDRVKIAVLVSGGGTNLQAMMDAEKSGVISSGTIDLVMSQNPDAYALERAKKNGIDAIIVSGEEDMIENIESRGIGLIVLAGYLRILSDDFIEKFRGRIINIHPSLIPSFCGKGCYGIHVHEKALEYGVKVTGATVHFVNEIPDGGEIISQKPVYVRTGDTPETLQRRVMEEAEWVLLPEAVEEQCRNLLAGKL